MSETAFKYARADTIEEVDREFYRCIFKNHPLPAWIYDPITLAFLVVNPAAIEEYQYSADEFLRMKVTDIRTADDVPELMRFLAEKSDSLEGTTPWRHKRKDGTSLDVTISSHDVTLRGRAAYLVVVRDISEKQQLRRERRIFEAAVAGASEAVIITDVARGTPGPQIVFANAAFTAMTGYEPHEVIGKSPGLLRGPKSLDISLKQIAKDLRKTESVIYESVNYRKDGSEYMAEWKLMPLKNEAGVTTHMLGLQRDITERSRTRERAQQAQKMEAVGRFAGGIAHDFNNLLTIILGYSGLLALELSKDPKFDHKRSHSLDEIQKATEKAAELTTQLLAFSRKEVLRARVFDPNPVILNVENMLRRLIGEDIDLKLVLADDTGSVFADPNQLEHVLMNLAANARDAMPNGGMLTIETQNSEMSQPLAGHSTMKAGSYVVLVVSDTGSGMDELTRDRAFEPFFTTKESGKGTGLGLAMVYGFAQQCGGAVGLYSEPGRGACFRIYLPRTAEAAEAEVITRAKKMCHGSGTILVVEDESAIRQLVKQILDNAGYVVFTAGNAIEAIEFSEGYSGRLDLLVTDVVLPGVSGPELADQLKANNPQMKVLFASGYSDHALLRQGTLEAGAAFVHKPFDIETLLGKVGSLMQVKKTAVSKAS